MGKTFGISEILAILKRHWVWVLAVALILGVVTLGFFSFSVEKTYTSTIAVYICSTGEITHSNALMSQEVAGSAVVLLTMSDDYISDNYLPIKEGETIRTEFSDYAAKGYGKEKIKSMLEFTVVNNTGVIRVAINGADKEMTKDIGNSLRDSICQYLKGTIVGTEVKPVTSAKTGVVTGPAVFRNTAIAFVLGALITYAVFAIMYILDNTIKDEETFKSAFDVPFLGEIPRIAQGTKGNSKKPSTSYSGGGAASFRFVETFKSIRTALFYVLPTMKNNIFAISSPGEREGKSTITFNLSASMAEANVRVLVIDADMRKPTIAKYFCLENKTGLSKILSRQCTFEDAVNKNVVPNLDILTSGPIPPNPSELLSGEAIDQLLSYVKDKYDYVIIDTAPINIVTDSLLLLNKIAGIVVVSRYGTTPYNEMQKAIDSISSVNGTVLGSVINDVIIADKAYSYKKGYKYTYKYSYSYGGHSDRKVATTFQNIGIDKSNTNK
ncbi:MAG: polysaccharide biosynthesis tyrosine autokinase [Ruminococcaceae bacterium]|nr:polysaccharide biosynthesis tyrosine autokinase [Oscillospiraceae bacterium]